MRAMGVRHGPPHVYGPVPSRRFGLSLGLDLVPHKVCCYDCVYCQVGRTSKKTIRREVFFPQDRLIAELDQALAERPRPDVITLAGSGEPTLYRGLGSLVAHIRSVSSAPVVLLTGGGLLWRDEVAEEALSVDVLAPSLDAGTPEEFRTINRPHPRIRFETMYEGLARALSRFHGAARLEVMVVPGMNDTAESLARLAALVQPLRLSTIDLNTPVRPAHTPSIAEASSSVLEQALAVFGPRSRVIGCFRDSRPRDWSPPTRLEELLVETLRRRPCTLQDLVAVSGQDPSIVMKVLDRLRESGTVEERRSRTEVFFWAPPELEQEGERPEGSRRHGP